jgi:predicted RNA-binding protein with PUA-like domain
MKSEPDVFSFADLVARGAAGEPWDGVRNYQARNFMRDHMRVGHWVLFYHSNADPAGVAGVARVVREATPDLSSIDPRSPSFDPKSTREDPRWHCVTVGLPTPLARFVPLEELRADARLGEMLLLRPGQRLSVLPLDFAQFARVCQLGGLDPAALALEND